MAINRNFYKKNSGSKKVLRQVIRPTHNKTAPDPQIDAKAFLKESLDSLPQVENEEALNEEKADSISISKFDQKPNFDSSEKLNTEIKSPLETPVNPIPAQTNEDPNSEIQQISNMIAQASAKLKELEEQKKQRELEATQAAQSKPVDEFDGVSDETEEIELIKAQLEKTQKDNKQLLSQMNLMKEEFEKEKKHLEKTVRDLKTGLAHKAPEQENKFFSFSKDLREAVEAIHSLESHEFQPIEKEVVIPTEPKILKIDESPTAVSPIKPVIEVAKQTPPPQTDEPKKEEIKKNEPEDKLEEKVSENKTAPKVEDRKEEDPHVKKKKKEKKLLISGVASLVVLVLGGFMSFKLTSAPKVDDKLVNDYLEANKNNQVLGVQSKVGIVPEGVVADKNAQISLEETHWAEYKDDNFGIRFDYPANVTERLHTASSITFLRKDSYIFKITKQTSALELEEFWNQQKDKGVSYEAKATEFKVYPALHLTISEPVEFPGDRYLIKKDDIIYDVFFITDPSKYDPEDVQRASKMIESLRFID